MLTYGLNLESKMSSIDVEYYFVDPGLYIVSGCPIQVADDNRLEVMILFSYINCLGSIPGTFLINAETGWIGFRTYTAYDGLTEGFSEDMISQLVHGTSGLMDELGDHIIDVALGYKSSEDVIAEIDKFMSSED